MGRPVGIRSHVRDEQARTENVRGGSPVSGPTREPGDEETPNVAPVVDPDTATNAPLLPPVPPASLDGERHFDRRAARTPSPPDAPAEKPPNNGVAFGKAVWLGVRDAASPLQRFLDLVGGH